MNLQLNHKLHNRFDVEVIDAVTGKIKQIAVGYNTILNQFWTRLFKNQAVWSHIQYGTGTGTPSASDTGLFTYLGGATASAATYDDSHYAEGWSSFTKSITLDTQTAVGATLTEVGFAGASSNQALCTHALLEDMNGNPTTITKTDKDIVIIYATVYMHWDTEGNNGIKFIPASHWFGEYKASGSLVLGKAFGSAQYTIASTGTTPVANSSNKTWTWGTMRVTAADGNVGGVSHILLTDAGAFDVDISGVYQITGESVGTGDGTQTEFSLAFDSPYDITVYVDGVEVTSGITTYPELSHYEIKTHFSSTYISYLNYLDVIDGHSTPTLIIPKQQKSTSKGTWYYYNPYYATTGIDSICSYVGYNGSSDIYASDDMTNWTLISEHKASITVPVAYKKCKFWKEVYNSAAGNYRLFYPIFETQPKAITFSTPPAAGAVITADYKTPFLPKDINHMYDFSLTVTLGEYTS